jgi:UDP-2-acetamido-2,6-beta-L-arabino-hexul-4-ose reductase
LKILISGHQGFIGRHLIRKLKCLKEGYDIDFLTKADFESNKLINKISPNDIIFHFAGVNRDVDDDLVFRKNNFLNESLLSALAEVKFKGKLLFTSSVQENLGTPYGKSKKNARLKFEEYSSLLGFKFYGVIAPNIFGPFCKPDYNSFIATFSSMLIDNKNPLIDNDKEVPLMYVGDFIDEIIKILNDDNEINLNKSLIYNYNVTKVLVKLDNFNDIYCKNGQIPSIDSHFDLCLFNTFRSYINIDDFFPRYHEEHNDNRGSFSELSRAFSQGQTSFSITKKGVTRGNHFHTKKIERFSVIKGKAKIEIREILTDKKFKFMMDGSKPSYVDIPIWHTHNIKNIGDEDLITVFWINEHYNEETSDTYLENV